MSIYSSLCKHLLCLTVLRNVIKRKCLNPCFCFSSGRTKRVYDGVDYDEPGEKVNDIPEMLTDE